MSRRLISTATVSKTTRRIGSINLRAYPNPAQPAVPATEVMTSTLIANPPDARDSFRQRFGRGISMDRIETSLNSSYRGQMRDITDLSRETVDTDPHLGSILNKRFGSVSSLPWELSPAEGPGIDSDKAEYYAAVVSEQLKNMKSLRQNLNQLAWALFDGRACLEKTWVVLDPNLAGIAEFAGLPKPTMAVLGLEWVHPRRLSFGPQRELRIQDEVRQSVGGNFASVGLPVDAIPDKFIWWTPQLFGEYPEREGLASRCLYWSFFKRYAARERMILTELFGKPWRIIEVNEESTAGGDELKAADEIADALGAQYTARMPRGTKLKVEQPQKTAGAVHADIIKESDSQLSKLVLGQTGTTDGVPSGLNSKQANVMQDEQLGILTADAGKLSEVIETRLTDRIIAVNFGEAEVTHAPRFVLRADIPADRQQELARLKLALDAGLEVKRSEAYDISGFSIPTLSDVVIRVDQPPTPTNSPVSPPPRPKIVYPQGTSPPNPEQQPPALPASQEAGALGVPASPVGAKEAATTTTVNEDRAARGLPALTLPDGSPDTRGDLTVEEFRQQLQANVEGFNVEQNLEIESDLADDRAFKQGVQEKAGGASFLGLSRVTLANVAHAMQEGEEMFGEAGIHAHQLNRIFESTVEDGIHSHLFQLPDGRIVETQLDGAHRHNLVSVDSDVTMSDGQHMHQITLDGGALLGTGAGISAHMHQLQVESTAVDGAHQHTLELGDPNKPGETITLRSLTAGQFIKIMQDKAQPEGIAGKKHKKVYSSNVQCRVVKSGSKYVAVSEDGNRKFGTYSSKKDAEERIRQVEFFKHQDARAAATFFEALALTQDHEFSVGLANAVGVYQLSADEFDPSHVCLELGQNQPKSANGSTEDLVIDSVSRLAKQVGKWTTTVERLLAKETGAIGLFAAIAAAPAKLKTNKFSTELNAGTEIGFMLGTIDSANEIQVEGDDEETDSVTTSKVQLAADDGKEFVSRPFADAKRFFESLDLLSKPSFLAASTEIQQRSFTVAGVLSDQMLLVVQDELAKAIQEGDDLRRFSKRIRPRLKQAGFLENLGFLADGTRALNASHIETVFRTNVLQTYNTGRFMYQSSPAVMATHPVWEVRVVRDRRTRNSHRKLHGIRLLANDPFWKTAYPPFGYNCRCRVVARGRATVNTVTTGSSIAEIPDSGFTSGRAALATGQAG